MRYMTGIANYPASDAANYTTGAEIVVDGEFLLSTNPCT